MKKQIVITLTETGQGWTGEIYGKIGTKRTDKTKRITRPTLYSALKCITLLFKIRQIEQWMEQIS